MSDQDLTITHDQLVAVLDALRQTAATVTAVPGPRPPARIRVGAGGVTLELEWAGPITDRAGMVVDSPGVPVAPTSGTVAALPAGTAPTSEPDGHVVTAPTVGTFYRASEPGASPFVTEGDVVSAGQQVGIVEAMKLMIPVAADRGGTVDRIVCDDATPVEFGAPLLVLTDTAG